MTSYRELVRVSAFGEWTLDFFVERPSDDSPGTLCAEMVLLGKREGRLTTSCKSGNLESLLDVLESRARAWVADFEAGGGYETTAFGGL